MATIKAYVRFLLAMLPTNAAVLFTRNGDLFIDLTYDPGTMRFSGKRE